MPERIHPLYLPFTELELLSHFIDVGHGANQDHHLDYYRKSAIDAEKWCKQQAGEPVDPPLVAEAHGLQMEKDERFWVVTALMKLYHGPDRLHAFAALLRRCFGETPSFAGASTWEEALGSDPRLYFEVNLPSPHAYREDLVGHLNERVLIPHLIQSAKATKGARLEGATKVDAMLVSDTGLTALFEAKVLADVSTAIRYDVLRNQLARLIDVMLEPVPDPKKISEPLRYRQPDRTCLALITPEIFKTHPSSRLYGWLMPRYQNPECKLLSEHLPHRDVAEFADIGKRLGWVTWQDINELLPRSCAWLPIQ